MLNRDAILMNRDLNKDDLQANEAISKRSILGARWPHNIDANRDDDDEGCLIKATKKVAHKILTLTELWTNRAVDMLQNIDE